MSAISTFLNDAADFDAKSRGERAIVTTRGGSPVELFNAIVLRAALNTRTTDGNHRLEYPLEVQIPMASYPTDKPVVKGDTIQVYQRLGDADLTTRTVAKLIGQVNGMWHLGLE